MSAPTDLEQYYLELINEARLDPMKNAARYIASYAPLVSSDPDIQDAVVFFGVDGAALLAAYQALTPVDALAWNNSLETAAAKHGAAMIAADMQSHQVPGEPGLGQRLLNEGYNYNRAGENVYAYAYNPLYGHAGFMVDWGYGPGGMQSPAGHRDNIMDGRYREVGIDVTAENDPSTLVGPSVVTQEFGARTGTMFILGAAYTDADNDDFYTPGEGRGDLLVTAGAVTASSTASGGYALASPVGQFSVTLTGGGLAGAVTVQAASQSGGGNLKLDVVDGDTLLASRSVSVLGPVATVRSITAMAVKLVTGAGDQSLIGGSGDDTLVGGGGDDTVVGGAGVDHVQFTGNRGDYLVTAVDDALRVADQRGAAGDGADLVSEVEFFTFADIVFAAADMTLNDPPPPAPPPAPEAAFRLVAASGFAGEIGGTGEVFGSNGFQDITILRDSGEIRLDGSFSRGGDVVRLPGDAGEYAIRVTGSSAILTSGDVTLSVPVGVAGLPLMFDDGVRQLVYDPGSGAITIGNQALSANATPITAPGDGTTFPDGTDASALARLVLTPGAEVEFGGNGRIFGTNSADVIRLTGGSIWLDGSFARGGDRLELDDAAGGFSAFVAGSFVTLAGADGDRIDVPIGIAGIAIDFAGDERSLRFDAGAGAILLGSQAITGTNAETATHIQAQGFA